MHNPHSCMGAFGTKRKIIVYDKQKQVARIIRENPDGNPE